MSAQMGNNARDHQSLGQYGNELDLREVFSVLSAGKIKMIAITVVFFGGFSNLCTVNA